jgi:hypothetical protein
MRAIGAAEAELDADAPDTAYKLLATAEMVNSTTLGVPGWSGFVRASRSPSHAAATLHRQAPRTLDAGLARETYLDALAAAIFAGRLNSGGAAQRSWPLRSAFAAA